MFCFPPGSPPRYRGFTLVELMVSMAVFSLILMVVLSMTHAMGDAWKSTRSKVEAFQGARQAFENITRTLSQATLNTYYDYFDAAGRTPRDAGYAGPARYGRQSELHFLSGKSLVPGQVTHAVFFQTPRGFASGAPYQNLDTLLNACGFYIVHGKDTLRPAFLDGLPNAPENRTRYRLMGFLQPSEQLGVYTPPSDKSWFQTPLAGGSPPVEQIAENIIALAVLPRRAAGDQAQGALAADYEYDSRAAGPSVAAQAVTHNQLPPTVEVVLVAIDEASARRLEQEHLSPPPLFTQAQDIDTDLAALEGFLSEHRMGYRIFRTVVPLRNSKWSS